MIVFAKKIKIAVSSRVRRDTMKGKIQSIYRFAVFLLVISLSANLFSAFPLIGNAASVTKVEKSYDIAVVFDNSGSMYQNQGWCRAKYAMEIFASMLNYNRDKLHIFPMWEVTTDGSQPSSGGSYKPIEIKSEQDIDKISNLYTVHPDNTPFAPITEAHDYLKHSSADEKWLIILTDGAFNQEARSQWRDIDLQKRVSALASGNIKVQYLGFGGATDLKANEENNFFAKKSSDTSLKEDLVGICNAIFQRSVLPQNRLTGTNLKLDLSMKNVIVFAQGKNAKITSLKNSAGQEVPKTLDSGQRKYSTISCNKSFYPNPPVDDTLAGQIVTFAACPKGEYILSYTEADKIQIFYEPDVDIDVSLTNSDGQKITNSDGFVAGEYTVTSRIVDASTGEDVTSHELMGNDVKIKTFVKTSKDSSGKEYSNGSKIVFEPDENTEIYIEGEYLGKYKISSKDDPKLAWLSDINVNVPSADFKVKVSAEQTKYKLKEFDSWKPIKVDLALEGQPLTEAQMTSTKLIVSTTDGLKYKTERISGESAYNIYILQDENGNKVGTKAGAYSVTASAKYTDEYGKEHHSSQDGVSVAIESFSFESKVSAEQTWYQLKKHDTWKPVKVTMTIDGQPLNEAQFATTKIAVKTTDGLKYRIEPVSGESAYYVYISQDESGKYITPETGEYELTATATYTDEFGNETNSKPGTVSFEIQKYSLLARRLMILGIILIILFLLAIVTFILHKIKVFPKKIDADNSIFKVGGKIAGVASASLSVANKNLFKKGGSINVRASRGNMGISLSIEAMHPLFKWPFQYQKSSRRKYRVTGISAGGMAYVKINGSKYVPSQFAEVDEICDNQTIVEFEKIVNSEKKFVKTDLINL